MKKEEIPNDTQTKVVLKRKEEQEIFELMDKTVKTHEIYKSEAFRDTYNSVIKE